MAKLDAVPTEYKGVRYRSKCEAMFARWLDLSNEELLSVPLNWKAFGYEYEPDGMDVDGWKLDFLSWRVHSSVNKSTGFLIPTIFYEFIEYKPSKPTGAYLETLGNRFDKLQAKLAFYDGLVVRSSFSCYCGSTFSEIRDCINYVDGEWEWSGYDWLINFESDVKSTRFDLVQHA